MSAIQIRPATIGDLPTVLKFEQGIIFAERPFDSTLRPGEIHYYDLEGRIKDPNSAVIVAEKDGKVVAGGSAIIKQGNPFNTFEQYAFLGFMYVEPDCRGQGINKMIVEKLIEWSHNKGLREIRLQVYTENTPAIRAYEKVGFKMILTEMRLVE